MFNTSSEYKKQILEDTRLIKYRGEIYTKDGKRYDFTERDIIKGSGYIRNDSSEKNSLEIASVYAGELGLSLLTNIDRYSLKDAQVKLYSSLKLKSGRFEEIPLGIFNIFEANRSKQILEITAYDNMIKLEKESNDLQLTGSPYDLAKFISEKCDLELAQTQEWFDLSLNNKETISIYPDNDIETYRDIVSYLAQILGSFATIDRYGRLEFRKYNTELVRNYGIKNRFTSTFSDFETRFTAVNSSNIKTQIAEYYALELDDGLTMNLGVNPLLQFGLKETRERLLRNILNDIAVIKYVPFEARVPVDPSLDLGDVIVFSGKNADENKLSCITSFNLKINGDMEISGAGANQVLNKAKSKNDKNITGLLNKVELGKAVTKKFINTSDYIIKEKRQLVSSIEFASKEETDVAFNSSIILEVINNQKEVVKKFIQKAKTETEENKEVELTFLEEEKSTIKVSYFLNDIEIKDYYPLESYSSGFHTLVLYYPIQNIKEKSLNTFKTFIEIDKGRVEIKKGKLLSTISGQSLSATNEWDGRIELNDSIRRIKLKHKGIISNYTEEISFQEKRDGENHYEDSMERIRLGGIKLKN
ncbi:MULTISPECIES: hypothetical protein [unclassified Gemella]|uniref:hypothetical protein n=1 Tax=unclassified Gemella TaxID=2624949 RepID=UPI0015D03DCE|nr:MULTISPECIES: hypothetical protein [unclassified Gemella]MBF0710458.1 hypothetical protein [Gemella sp. GL1.1]NYS27802.1 hypothetical protein [Gemella sp. GL1]